MAMESKKAEEIRKKAEAEANKILKEAEKKGRLIIEEAKKKADALSNEVLREVEQKGRLIIEEARKSAESQIKSTQPSPDQKARQIMEDARVKAEAEASKIIAEAEQKGRLIIDEAREKAESQAKGSQTAPDTDQKARQIMEDARVKAEAEASKIIAEAEQKGRLIIEEAQKVAGSKAKSGEQTQDVVARANEIIAEAERKARQRIKEAERIAAALADQSTPQIMKAIKKTANSEIKEKPLQPKGSQRKHVDIIVASPVDFGQLEKLRTSLHRLPGLRILSIGGSPGGATQISVMMDKPESLAENLNAMEFVEEAVEEELLDSHPLRDFLRKVIPSPVIKQPPDKQIVLVVLKKVQ
jgi:vacuolar-type H+-ATPase subunit H